MATRALEPKQPEENVVWIGHLGWEASPEHIIVLVDEFRSGNECPSCLDKEHRLTKGGLDGLVQSVVECDNCHGKGKYGRGDNEFSCSPCGGTGKIPCPVCKGTGTTSIATPDNAKDAPTTGTVASVGSETTLYKLGDRVCFTSYSGHQFDITSEKDGKPILKTIRILVERDILARVHGQLAKKDIKRSMALNTGA